METGWRHNDDETRKEFERLKNRGASAEPQEDSSFSISRGGGNISGTGGQQPLNDVEVTSPLDTITVVKRYGPQLVIFDIDRPFTIAENGVDIIVRSPNVVNTVEKIDFVDTATVTWDVDSTATDVIRVRATSAAAMTWDLTIQDDNVAVGGNDTHTINFDSNGQTATDVAVNFVVTDNTAGKRSVKGYIPAASLGGMSSWYLAVNDESPGETITDGEKVTINGLGPTISRSTNKVLVEYRWIIRTNGNASLERLVYDKDIVDIHGRGGIVVSQTNTGNTSNVFINFNGEVVGSDGKRRRSMTGYIELANGVGSPAPGYHGAPCWEDIVHDWDLSDMHGYQLTIKDAPYSEATGVAGGLSRHLGNPDAWGLNGIKYGFIRTRSFAKHFAVDSNTIRVYASRPNLLNATGPNAPTVLRYHFELHEIPI